MPTVEVFSQDKKKVGTMDLRDDVFAAPVNVALVHQVIKAQLAGRRQGTAKTKTKAEVRGGGKKPFRQKGTGNARQGSSRSPLHPGGGQNFGPIPRSYEQSTPKEMVRGALRSALSDRFKSERMMVVDEFSIEKPKTKIFNELLTRKLEMSDVLIVDDANQNLERSARNVAKVKVLRTEGINVYDIIRHEWVILTKRAAQAVQDRLMPNATDSRAEARPSKAAKAKETKAKKTSQEKKTEKRD